MKPDRFKTFTASMIAFVTVVSALVTWRAALASLVADQEDFTGLAAVVNAEESLVLSQIDVAEHYQSFLDYVRYNDLGNKLSEASAADELKRTDPWGIAYGLQSGFFPSRYLRPDGTYDAQRELDERLADAQRSRDTRYDVHFKEADTHRLKVGRLVTMLIVLSVSFWMFTLAQILDHGIKYVFAAGGLLFLAVGSFGALLVDVLM